MIAVNIANDEQNQMAKMAKEVTKIIKPKHPT